MAIPIPPIDGKKRVLHFQGQFLDKDDFNEAHEYHLTMRRRLNYGLFKYGIIDGLDFDESVVNTTFLLKKGMALDKDDLTQQSREIILFKDLSQDLVSLGYNIGDSVYFTIAYTEKDDNFEDVAGFSGFSRKTEQAVIKIWPAPDPDPPDYLPGERGKEIIIGKVTINAASLSYDYDKREIGGIVSTISKAPTISSFTPTSGVPGDSISIMGTNFTSATEVCFGGVPVLTGDFTIESVTKITAKVPVGAVSGKIRVTTPNGSAESLTDFMIIGLPTITNFIPQKGPRGTPITIYGTNFINVTDITFGGEGGLKDATFKDFKGSAGTPPSNTINPNNSEDLKNEKYFKVKSPTEIEATVPEGAVDGVIIVKTSGQSSEPSMNSFDVESNPVAPNPNLKLSTADRTRAPGGELSIINYPTGSNGNFVNRLFVIFNTRQHPDYPFPVGTVPVEVEGTVIDANNAKVIVPNDAQTGYIKIKTQGGETECARWFVRGA